VPLRADHTGPRLRRPLPPALPNALPPAPAPQPPRRAFFQGRFEELQQGLFAQQPALFPPATFTFDHFLWAVSAVRARTHAPLEAERIALVPLADSLPHRRGANAAWKVKAGGLFNRQQVGGALRAAAPPWPGPQLPRPRVAAEPPPSLTSPPARRAGAGRGGDAAGAPRRDAEPGLRAGQV
jgi:hypothetical protein